MYATDWFSAICIVLDFFCCFCDRVDYCSSKMAGEPGEGKPIEISLQNHEFERGRMLIINGCMEPMAGYFSLDIEDNKYNNSFRLVADLAKNTTIWNKIENGDSVENGTSPVPFLKANESFKLELHNQDNYLLIRINGSIVGRLLISGEKRVLSIETHFYIIGNVSVTEVCYQNSNLGSSFIEEPDIRADYCEHKWANEALHRIIDAKLNDSLTANKNLTLYITPYASSTKYLLVTLLKEDLVMDFVVDHLTTIFLINADHGTVIANNTSLPEDPFTLSISSMNLTFEVFLNGRSIGQTLPSIQHDAQKMSFAGYGYIITGVCLL